MQKILMGLVCLILSANVTAIGPEFSFDTAQNSDKQTKQKKEKTTKSDTLIFGGAFRYTYMNNSWDASHREIGGRAIFDVLILNARGSVKGIDFAMESRYYAESFGGFMLRNGYVGLPVSDNFILKLGMPRTPFGIVPFTSNSFMFNMQYYLGFEDDADIGGLLEYSKGPWAAQLSFAKNSEDIFSQTNNRYAYDISGDHQELNQLTGRAVWTGGEELRAELGLSGQVGGIYNKVSESRGNRWAGAAHTKLNKDRWELKAELMAYEFSGEEINRLNYIEMGAFAADYQLAKEGVSYSVALSYTIPVNHLLLNDIKFYNDFSALDKALPFGTSYSNEAGLTGSESESLTGFDASYMNVTGCMIHTGPIYMLIDYVVAKNHPWIGSNYMEALSAGGDSKWNTRFNVNLGIYF